MRCRKFKSYLSKYYDGELSFKQEESLKEHAESCSSCREELYQTDNLKEMLSDMEILEPSPDFNYRLREKIGEPECEMTSQITLTFRQKAKWALATCLVTIVLLSAIVLTDPRFSIFVEKPSLTTQPQVVPDEYQILVEPSDIHFVIDNYRLLPQRGEIDSPKRFEDHDYILEKRAFPQMGTSKEHFILPAVSTKTLIEDESY